MTRTPRFSVTRRPTSWGPGLIVWALQEFERREGRRMTAEDLRGEQPRPYVPSHETIRRNFKTWSAAYEAAYGEPAPPQGGASMRRDEDTARVVAERAAGRTLTELAAERGITPQALGRRVAHYQERSSL